MSGTLCESRLPGGRSPWSTCCLGPNPLHTPQNSNWECKIPMGIRPLKINIGQSPVMVIFDRFMRIQNHPHDRACMHDQKSTPNSRSSIRITMPTLLGRAICCCTTEIPEFKLRMPDSLMECSES